MQLIHMLDEVESLNMASSLNDFWDKIRLSYNRLGVDSIFYGFVPSKRHLAHHGMTKASFFRSDHPQEWIDTLGVENFLDNDLNAEMTLIGGKPSVWHDVSQWQGATPEQISQAYFERDIGLYVGITLPTTLFHREHVGAVSLNMTQSITDDEFYGHWNRYGEELTFLSSLLDTRMREQYMDEFFNLTLREQDVLCFAASGLCNKKIARHMKVGPHTIEKHMGNILKKLSAESRTHAVSIALQLNLIQP